MNKKAILLHLDGKPIDEKSQEMFRFVMTAIQTLYTSYFLGVIQNIDIIVHSVRKNADFMSGLNGGNIVFVEDELAAKKTTNMFFSRLYSYLCPQISKYDEVITFDSDFLIKDMNRFQRLVDIDINNDIVALGKVSIKQDNLACMWGALVKLNMKLFKDSFTEKVLDDSIEKYNLNKFHNFDENVLVRIFETLGLKYQEVKEEEYEFLTHYWWSPSLHNKIKCTLNAINNPNFVEWVRCNDMYFHYQNLVDSFFNIWLDKYKWLFDSKQELLLKMNKSN